MLNSQLLHGFGQSASIKQYHASFSLLAYLLPASCTSSKISRTPYQIRGAAWSIMNVLLEPALVHDGHLHLAGAGHVEELSHQVGVDL